MVDRIPPGSFSKHYGWDGQGAGLSKLHTAIRKGFAGASGPIRRTSFRNNIGEGAQLVPSNFFLHTGVDGGVERITVDELVRRALDYPHDGQFDRLALFALHLAMPGRSKDGKTVPGGPYLNDYARNHLWKDGAWRRAAVDKAAITAVFSRNVAYSSLTTLTKVRNNYFDILRAVGLTGQAGPLLNSRWEEWHGSAALLLFDRVSVDRFAGAVPDRTALVDAAKEAEFHKLVGASWTEVTDPIDLLASAYVAEGGLGRTSGVALPTKPTTPSGPAPSKAPHPQPTWSDEAAFEAAFVQRRLRQVRAQLRKPKNVRELKALYENRCCFCDRQVQVGVDPNAYYSEAAHIRPLGEPHRGPDVRSNMILLCPEHHLQFDRGVLRINANSMTIESRIAGDPLHGRSVSPKGLHSIDPIMARWHFDFWSPV